MVIKTLVLKLHNPSAHKRAILDDALTRYALAFEYALRQLEPLPEDMRSRPVSRLEIMRLFTRDMLERLNELGVQPFKDALKMDAAITLTSYLGRLRAGKKASWPTSRLEDSDFEQRFDALCASFKNVRDFRHAYDKLLKKHRFTRPLPFYRYDALRDYCLLYDEKTGRFYAKLYLLGAKSPLRRSPSGEPDQARLRYVGLGGRALENDLRPRRYIIVPLDFGKWQEEYLKTALNAPDRLKTALLVPKDGEYYLHVKLACPAPEPLETRSFMGVTRSLKGYLCVSVHENEYTELYSGHLFSPRDALDPRPAGKALLHALANEVVKLALQFKSQIIVYNLGQKKDMLDAHDAVPLLNMGKYNQLAALIAYKAELAGLPRPVTVSPTHVFNTCPVCRHTSRKNRMNPELFLCTSCGYIRDVEELGSRNLALKLHTYKSNKVVFRASVSEDQVRFSHPILDFCFDSIHDAYARDRFFQRLAEYVQAEQHHPHPKKQTSILKKLAQMRDLKDGVAFVEN
jgi:putative transposase